MLEVTSHRPTLMASQEHVTPDSDMSELSSLILNLTDLLFPHEHVGHSSANNKASEESFSLDDSFNQSSWSCQSARESFDERNHNSFGAQSLPDNNNANSSFCPVNTSPMPFDGMAVNAYSSSYDSSQIPFSTQNETNQSFHNSFFVGQHGHDSRRFSNSEIGFLDGSSDCDHRSPTRMQQSYPEPFSTSHDHIFNFSQASTFPFQQASPHTNTHQTTTATRRDPSQYPSHRDMSSCSSSSHHIFPTQNAAGMNGSSHHFYPHSSHCLSQGGNFSASSSDGAERADLAFDVLERVPVSPGESSEWETSSASSASSPSCWLSPPPGGPPASEGPAGTGSGTRLGFSSSRAGSAEPQSLPSQAQRRWEQAMQAAQKVKVTQESGSSRGVPSKPLCQLPPCRICGYTSSGFHYGANTCEACKGFFRRALKKKGPFVCSRHKKCDVRLDKRNMCGYCRYQICIKEGMSKSAIKTGRHTHEKRTQDILEIRRLQEEEARKMNQREQDELHRLLVAERWKSFITTGPSGEDIAAVVSSLLHVHDQTWPVTGAASLNSLGDQFLLQGVKNQNELMKQDFLGSPLSSQPDCDFFQPPSGHPESGTDTPATHGTRLDTWLRGWVDFAHTIPGFHSLSTADRLALLRDSCIEIWTLGDVTCPSTVDSPQVGPAPSVTFGHMKNLDQMPFQWCELPSEVKSTLKKVKLTQGELVLLKALCLCSPDRSDLEDLAAVERIQNLMLISLQHVVRQARPSDMFASVIGRAMAAITSVRELSSAHFQSENEGGWRQRRRVEEVLRLELARHSQLDLPFTTLQNVV